MFFTTPTFYIYFEVVVVSVLVLFFLYCTLLTPITTPRNTATASIVPPISVPYGNPQIWDTAVHKTLSAGITMTTIQNKMSYTLSLRICFFFLCLLCVKICLINRKVFNIVHDFFCRAISASLSIRNV